LGNSHALRCDSNKQLLFGFFYPGSLDSFEDFFAATGVVIVKLCKIDDQVVQIVKRKVSGSISGN
jgi:hypothetical protein